MNYKDVLEQIRDLGFSDDDELEEFGSIVPNAINRAITEISMNYAPIVSHYDIVQPSNELTEEEWDEKGYSDSIIEYDMPEDFLKFTNIPVKRELSEGVYQRFSDYEIEEDNTILFSGKNLGTYRVFYVADHTPFTEETDGETEIPLPLKAHHLLPLLASYYVWLDDDQTKAQAYYSEFQQLSQNVLADTKKPKIRIRTDWGDGIWV